MSLDEAPPLQLAPRDIDDVLHIEHLRRHGRRPALIDGTTTVSFDALADRVTERIGSRIDRGRHVEVVVGTRTVDTVVALLAAFELGNPVALATDIAAAAALEARCCGARDLHPDLALLLGTSGTTGASKLVRLSKHAVMSNATAIAASLRLTSDDRAITALPLHYCYGLSVVTSHLAVGASVVLSDAAVVDPCFWGAVDQWAVTGIAGVPHTFDLLDQQRRHGVDRLVAPSLRYVTQAGGRLEPARVAELVARGDQYGFDFVVMYGQTEATARMTVLDPDDARTSPQSIGRPIPGGSIELRPVPDAAPGVGEIVYTGPNVMMGYASSADDLGRGAELSELRTGDLARRTADGLLEIVGRANRIVKVHGVRTDLDQLESDLADRGIEGRCTGDDDGLVVARLNPARSQRDDELHAVATQLVALPGGCITAITVPEWPRTASGKLDRPAITAAARRLAARTSLTDSTEPQTVRSTFELIVGSVDSPSTDSFASLGGDSFSYVEMSIRLEPLLGTLPADWHLQTIDQLSAQASEHDPVRPSRWARIDTSVAIRAIGILLIVCTHMQLYRLPGGAHTLLLVVGYNVARFQLHDTEQPGRLRRSIVTVSRVAVPTMAWIGTQMALFGGYSLGALFLVNTYFGSPWRRDGRWEYWYFETFVQAMIVIALLFAIPAVRRAERRAPFEFALALLAVTLLFRFGVIELGDSYNAMFRLHTVACFIALGWAAQRASNVTQRLMVTALLAATSVDYFGQVDREWRIIVLGAALIWLPTLRVPRQLVAPIGTVAAASMYIFLVHWQVWPIFTPWLDRHVAFVATIVVGIGVWWASEQVTSLVRARRSAADPTLRG